MKKNSIILSAAVAAVYFALAGRLQAIPPPPTVPDSGSTGILLGVVISGLFLLKCKLKLW